MKLSEIAAFLDGELIGDPEIEITGLAKIESAGPGELTFLANPKYTKYIKTTKASAILVADDTKDISLPHIKLADPYLAFLDVLKKINPSILQSFDGIHPSTVISPTAKIGKDVQIGPFTYIGDKVIIGHNSTIFPGCVILNNVQIGNHTILYPNVSVREDCMIGDEVIIHNGTVIGSDGFGFAPSGEVYKKIPQMGKVIIEDNVEIGANCAIDRATLGETIIKKGCKIDNLVQIAHNVEIEENTVIAAQTGISGSTKVGKHVTLAGQVGIVGHVKIGDKAIIAAKSGVSKNIPAEEVWFGYPAQPIMKQKKIEASLRHLPELTKKIHNLEKTLIELEEKFKYLGGGNEREATDD